MSNRADGVESDQVARGITATMTHIFHCGNSNTQQIQHTLPCDIGYIVDQCLAVDSEQWHVFVQHEELAVPCEAARGSHCCPLDSIIPAKPEETPHAKAYSRSFVVAVVRMHRRGIFDASSELETEQNREAYDARQIRIKCAGNS